MHAINRRHAGHPVLLAVVAAIATVVLMVALTGVTGRGSIPVASAASGSAAPLVAGPVPSAGPITKTQAPTPFTAPVTLTWTPEESSINSLKTRTERLPQK